MALTILVWLSNPIMWMIVMMLVAFGARAVRSEPSRDLKHGSQIVRVGNGITEAATTALMFLSTTYRPSVEFVAQTQIQQQEDADDDAQGGPDSPRKQFNRQLRRIRNGENVDRLVWRLE